MHVHQGEHSFHVILQKKRSLRPKVVRQSDEEHSLVQDFTVVEEFGVGRHALELVQAVLLGKPPPLGEDVRLWDVAARQSTCFGYRFVLTPLQDVPEIGR